MTRLTLTVFVLALATTAAQAGPIRWTYNSPYTERDIPGVANVKIWEGIHLRATQLEPRIRVLQALRHPSAYESHCGDIAVTPPS